MSGNWIVFLGAPGCGKGTQAEYLIREDNFKVMCVGDLLRENKEYKLESGQTVSELLSSGSLLPDSVIIEIVKSQLNSMENAKSENILFDGFPRTLGQAEALDSLVDEFDTSLSTVFNFVVEDEVISKRILGRYKCSTCGKIYNKYFLNPQNANVCDVCSGTDFEQRTDDNEETLAKRLAEYHSKTKPLIDFYSKSAILYNVDAEKSFEEVRKSILDGLK